MVSISYTEPMDPCTDFFYPSLWLSWERKEKAFWSRTDSKCWGAVDQTI